MRKATTLVFHGRLNTESFIEFARHRAVRLALQVAVRRATPNRIDISVAGDEALVDAFELACTLGPLDCLVLDHHRVSDIECQRQTGDLRSCA